MSKWEDIRTALKTYLTGLGYTVYGESRVSRSFTSYIVIDDGDEANISEPANVGNTKYRKQKSFDILVYNKATTEATIDEVKRKAKAAIGVITDKLTDDLSTCYNIIGDAGAIMLTYGNTVFEDVEAQGMYAPVRGRMSFTIQYTINRKIS